MNSRIRVVEFKLTLTPAQRELIDSWLDLYPPLWNLMLDCVEEWENYRGYCISNGNQSSGFQEFLVQDGVNFLPCCPLLETHGYYLYLDAEGEIIENPSDILKDQAVNQIDGHQRILVYFSKIKEGKNPGFTCPIRRTYFTPRFIAPKNRVKIPMDLDLIIRSDFLKVHAPQVLKIPYKLRRGISFIFTNAYTRYKNKQANKPRHKYKFNTLIDSNPTKKDQKILPNDQLTSFPGFRKLKHQYNKYLYARGLNRRWIDRDGAVPTIDFIKIVRTSSGKDYYLQLTGKFPLKRIKAIPGSAIAIMPSHYDEIYLKDSQDGIIKIPDFITEKEAHINKLNSVLHKKKAHCFILWVNDFNHLKEGIIKKILPDVSKEKIENLSTCNTWGGIVSTIGNWDANKLLWRYPIKSKRQEFLLQMINDSYNTLHRQRVAFNHCISSDLTSKYESIIIVKNDVDPIKLRNMAWGTLVDQLGKKGNIIKSNYVYEDSLRCPQCETITENYRCNCELSSHSLEHRILKLAVNKEGFT